MVFLTPLHRAETGCAGSLLRLARGTPAWGRIDPAVAIPWVEKKTGLTLSPSQRQAVEAALTNKVLVLTGGPGVGKTTIVNSILKILLAKRMGSDVLYDQQGLGKLLEEHLVTMLDVERFLYAEWEQAIEVFEDDRTLQMVCGFHQRVAD